MRRRRHTASTRARHDADASCPPEVAAAVMSDVPNKVCTVCSNDRQNAALCARASTSAIRAGDCCEHWPASPAYVCFAGMAGGC